jgi:serine/threonine-protein kinase
MVGQTLGGRYMLGDLLGEGGWGAVYAATQTDLGRPVAIKVLRAEAANDPDLLARFEREAKAAAGLGHPNIALVTELCVRPGEPPFLVMERLAGRTLGSEIKSNGRLAPARVAWIAHQMLAALDVAHAAGIVHRDVKPENIFLVSMPGIEDFVKLLDFGIAKLADKAAPQLTQSDTMLGSPAYMAPEQVRGIGIDHRTDLYAVGATMYHALTGRYPFDAPNLHGLLLTITEQRATPVSMIDPSIDQALSAVVDRAMAKDPAGRFGSAAEMRSALEQFLAPAMRARAGSASAYASSVGVPPTAANPHGPATTTAGVAMSATPYGPPPTPGVVAPYGPPPTAMGATPYGPPPTPAYALPQATAPAAPAPAAKGSGAIIALLAIIAVLLVVAIGGGAWLFLRSSSAAPVAAPVASSSAAAAAPVSAVTPSAAPSGTASAPVAAGGAPRKPGATATTSAPGAAPAVPDAGAAPPVASRKQMGGTSPFIGAMDASPYEIAEVRTAVNGVMGAVAGCYAATEFDPPDHQFNFYFISVGPTGQVTGVAPVTDASNHPKLNPCLSNALRGAKFPAKPGGGRPKISFTARTKDNP